MLKNNNILDVIAWIVPLLSIIVVHEIAKARAALYYGDKTAKTLGKLTYNPVKNMHIIGTFIVPIIFWVMRSRVFGWAYVIPVSKKMLNKPQYMIAIAACGLASCIGWAMLWLTLEHYYRFFHLHLGSWCDTMLRHGKEMSIAYAVIHLLPIPPMDAYYFLDIIMPKRAFFYYSKIGKWGLIAVGCLLWFGYADIYIDMLTIESLKYIEYFLKKWIWL